jgi:hypothetical protein
VDCKWFSLRCLAHLSQWATGAWYSGCAQFCAHPVEMAQGRTWARFCSSGTLYPIQHEVDRNLRVGKFIELQTNRPSGFRSQHRGCLMSTQSFVANQTVAIVPATVEPDELDELQVILEPPEPRSGRGQQVLRLEQLGLPKAARAVSACGRLGEKYTYECGRSVNGNILRSHRRFCCSFCDSHLFKKPTEWDPSQRSSTSALPRSTTPPAEILSSVLPCDIGRPAPITKIPDRGRGEHVGRWNRDASSS